MKTRTENVSLEEFKHVLTVNDLIDEKLYCISSRGGELIYDLKTTSGTRRNYILRATLRSGKEARSNISFSELILYKSISKCSVCIHEARGLVDYVWDRDIGDAKSPSHEVEMTAVEELMAAGYKDLTSKVNFSRSEVIQIISEVEVAAKYHSSRTDDVREMISSFCDIRKKYGLFDK